MLQSKAQQLFTYTQYMNNLTPINHTYSLLDEQGSVSAIYRKQWAGIEGSPSTFLFSSAFPLQRIGAAAGITVMDDKFAVEHQTEINAYFAKSVRLSEKGYLAVSMDAGVRRYVASYSSVAPDDPMFLYSDVRETRPNLGFGVMYYSDNYYLGVSVPQFNLRSLGVASAEKNTYFRNHYYVQGAYLSGQQGDDFRVKPAFLFQATKGVPATADVSTTVYIKSILGIGANYRTNNEMAGILSVQVDGLRLGYAYQFGTANNNISQFTFATHEIMLTYSFGSRGNNSHKLL
ncbi:PorP/SprF family type IX secretion system membrane protein [Mucilaginibacter robiniae]|uniref:PorP/SprF family type IX secretion system membrane protein n=2 Tax=Mucilaginibacter robiniae TaxID=2728022 RepID=A0A7L5DYD3_9SPHI|nr:PorP/SprF family type IX secretion system membrane protein [Mucilaginibacter robiniae]